MRLRKLRRGAAIISFSLLAGACGGTASDTGANSDEDSAREVRAVLAEANDLARVYGREHLGHYLRLNVRKLVAAGLEVPDDLDLAIGTNHLGYCITATSKTLSNSHAWAIATTSPKGEAPSPSNKCARGRY